MQKNKFMKISITHWSPKNSNIHRFYVKSENQDLGYIQFNFDGIKANQETRSTNIKLVGDELILDKIVKFQSELDLHAFLIQNAQNAVVLGSKDQVKAQKSKLLTIN